VRLGGRFMILMVCLDIPYLMFSIVLGVSNVVLGSTLVELGLDNKPSAEFVSTEDTAERCATLLAQL
jgi:hypothetical protein